MTVIGEAFVVVRPDTKGFASQAETEVESGLGGAVKKAGLLIGGALALGGAKEFVGSLVDAGREAEKLGRQTQAVLASTGGAANVSADEVEKLGTSLSQLDGIDRKTIENNENLLLTFTNVKNQVGQGNDVFTRATALTLDMSKALGEDGASASIQLGKALNDPIRGITALQRVGVTFTAQQRDQIKAMVASGDSLSAQKVILDELGKEFGGSAAAQADAGDRLSVTWENMKETLGEKLLPVIDTLAGWLADVLPGALDATFAAFGKLGGGIADFVEGFTKGTDDIGSSQSVFAQWGAVVFEVFDKVRATVVPIITQLAGDVQSWVSTIIEAFKTLAGDDGPQGFGEIMDNLLGNSGKYVSTFRTIGESIVSVGRFIRDPLIPAIQEVVAWIGDHWQVVLLGAVAALGLLTAPLTTLTIGLVALYARSETFRNAVQRMIDISREFGAFLQRDVAPSIVRAFDYIKQEVSDFVTAFSQRFDKIRAAVTNVLTAIKIELAILFGPIILLWQQFSDEILSIVASVFDQLKNTIATAVRVITDIFDFVIAILTGQWGDAWAAISDIPKAALDWITGLLNNAFSIFEQLFSIVGGTLADAWWAIWDAITSAAGDALNAIVTNVQVQLQSIVDFVTGLPAQLAAGAAGLWDWLSAGLVSAIDTVIDLFNRGIDFLNSFQIHVHKTMPSIIPNVDIDWDGLNIPHIPMLAEGAFIKSRPGGIMANIGEGLHDEVVMPLPTGLLEGLMAITRDHKSTRQQTGPLVHIEKMVTPEPAYAGIAIGAEMRSVQWRQRR